MPRPSFVLVALCVATGGAGAQDPMRPWLRWRTVDTENYQFHYTADLEQYTRHVAARVERIDSALAATIGWTPERRVQVVVHDPFSASNGYALPLLEQPATVWWATPPDPRNDIGNFTTWGEMIAVHELAHLAHLTRPSRNPFTRAIWNSLPSALGPIAVKSPRWIVEGYATYVEGRVTGSGRPHNAWRPAILRQWAIEGQLPSYAALSGSDAFNGGAFAYLGGSAFLEWLAEREGDSTLVHLWRRLTARQQRSFDAAFRGVYGDGAPALYGRHTAELTRDAMAASAALERAGLVEGEMIQRLAWETGDPAVSPDGSRVAITLRDRTNPARVVVWSTAEEPEDTAAVRRRIEALTKDPIDVPDRRFFPRPKKPIRTLPALNLRSFQHPRWFPDNRRLLVTRWTPKADGSVAPDLWTWDTGSNDLRRITRGAGVLHGDVAPDGSDAVATQCHWGHCDVARVDLERGAVRTLLEGNAELSYYRPRYSPDGSRIAAAMAENGRWRVVVADRNGRMMRAVDPDDGANRYDAEWMGSDSLVVVSEAGGIANLEIIDLASGATRSITRVTGAAVAPAVNRVDRSLWFLSMHARGLDLRRIGADAPRADSAVTVTAERYGFAGLNSAAPRPLAADSLAPSRGYGRGPLNARWLPGAYASADGAGAFLTIFATDIVGRLGASVTGAYGQRGTVQGGSFRATWRYLRPALEVGVHGFLHEPSLSRLRQAGSDSLDVAVSQNVLAFSASRAGDGWGIAARLGGSAGSISPQIQGGHHFRGLGFAELTLSGLQGRGGRALVERLRLHATQGHTRAGYQRGLASLDIETAGPEVFPIQLRAVVGRIAGSPHPYERFRVGGGAPAIGDSSAMSQHWRMPALPTAVAEGKVLMAWRVAFPTPGWTPYFEGASAGDTIFARRSWHRAIGMEMNLEVPPVPVVFTPRARARVGAAYTLDAPFRRRVRGYVSMQFEP